MLIAAVPSARAQINQSRRERMHWVVRELRIGDMPLHAMHGEMTA